MKIIYQYNVFNDNNTFVEWQEDNNNYIIHQLSPVTSQMDITNNQNEDCVNAYTGIGIFVVYSLKDN